MLVPRWFQEEATYSVFDYYRSGKTGHPIIAMPTGTGKSAVIAFLVWMMLRDWPHVRVMMVTHVSKLISQNANMLLKVWGSAPLGIHSAGLDRRDVAQPIIYGGIQSIVPFIKAAIAANMPHFGWRDVIFIDECHLISDDDMAQYRFFFNVLMVINPDLKIIGLTATPYRLKKGSLLEEGGIFTDICYDITGYESFNRLVAEGFMAPLIARPTINQIDMQGVGTTAGEFNSTQTAKAVMKGDVLEKGLGELVQWGWDRRAWIVFLDSIANADIANEILQGYGIESAVVHSRIKKSDEIITAYQNGEYQALINKDMLTTGFDHPIIDLIGDFQPTKSPGKHVQKNGRGTRPAEGKLNCLCADFAGNIPRLGPINDPKLPRKPGKGGGDAPVRLCPLDKKDERGQKGCGTYNHAAARFCMSCGFIFPFEGSKFFALPGDHAPMRGDEPIVEMFKVTMVLYNLHEKRDSSGNLISPPSMKVTYICGLRKFNEWVCLEHGGTTGMRAKNWWRGRHYDEPPATTAEALRVTAQLRAPSNIRVWVNAKYPQVMGHEFI